jgi:hypothetical protein
MKKLFSIFLIGLFLFSAKPVLGVNSSGILNGYYLTVEHNKKAWSIFKVINNSQTVVASGNFTNNFIYPTDAGNINLTYNPNFIFKYNGTERAYFYQSDFPFINCGAIYNYGGNDYNIDCGYFIPTPTPTGAYSISVDAFKDLDNTKTPVLNKFLQQYSYTQFWLLTIIICLLLFEIFVKFFKRK